LPELFRSRCGRKRDFDARLRERFRSGSFYVATCVLLKSLQAMRRLPSVLLLTFAGSFVGIAQGGTYTTYIGDAFPYQVKAMVTDAAGNTYITGARTITPSTIASGPPLCSDVFVTRLDGAGNLLFTTILSGKGSDVGNGIAVDSAGNIWVAGSTSSTDFPLRNPLQATSAANGGTGTSGFLTKLSADGGILFSTVLGGTQGYSAMNAVAVDASGNAYVAGYTSAPDYQRTAGLPAGTVIPGGVSYETAAFFAKISASGDRFIYAGGVSITLSCNPFTCGTGLTSAAAIAVDAAANCYIAGNGGGTGLPVTPGALLTTGAGAFVMKINAAGTGLVYLTMLDATAETTLTAIAADAAGNAYIAGSTADATFPAASVVLQPAYSARQGALAAKLNPSGTAMVWASYLGVSAAAAGRAIALDASENVWVSGVGGPAAGGEFLLELNAGGSALLQEEGFPADTVAAAMEVDGSGLVHTAGTTGIVSAMTPSLAPGPGLLGIGNAAGGVLGGRFAPSELISLYGQFPVTITATASFNAAGFLPDNLAGVQVTIGGIAAPLLYVSGTQINAVAPGALTTASIVQVVVTAGGAVLPGYRAVIDAADPQVFRNADGSAIAINQDGSLNSAAHPAPQGSVVAIWATGTGFVGGSTDGQEQTMAQNSCSCSIDEDEFGSTLIFPAYAGAAPGTVNGLTQINFKIPSPPDTVNDEIFRLFAGGQLSDETFVFVH